ncbi:uncharacterized protein [Spinacia oleracea]|uniref:Uncharacterized protein n=1 Tax=Spinacia oleracea TaxID=3562 RepID=A0A9R0INX2_SPIOL|nr:uncharacterized protein LOC110792098 [Spinacia oleracea]
MKKLYRKGQVHPSPPPQPPSPPPSSDQFSLSYLPAAILTLALSLSSQDQQVLAYLLSCSCSSSSSSPFDFDPSKSSSKKQSIHLLQQHPSSFTCYCFSCYTNYWALWDSSPNRQLIHEIIDAFEDNLMSQRKMKKKKNKQGGLTRREKRKNNNNKGSLDTNSIISDTNQKVNDDINHANGLDGSGLVNTEVARVDSVEEEEEEGETGEVKQGSVRKIVSFIGERIWGSVWG